VLSKLVVLCTGVYDSSAVACEESFVVDQVTHEMMSYDSTAHGPYQHTWWITDYGGQWEKTVFFPAATTGMDTNTTIDVCTD